MDVLRVIPVEFNIEVEIPGEFKSIEVMDDYYVIRGLKGDESYLWLAGTGSVLPRNVGFNYHLQTYTWNSNSRYVVHVFRMATTAFPLSGVYRVYRERANIGRDFKLQFSADFLHAEGVGDSRLVDMWFYTDAVPEQATTYQVRRVGDGPPPHYKYVFSNGAWSITKHDESSILPFDAPAPRRRDTNVNATAEAVSSGFVFNYEKETGDQRLVRLQPFEWGNNGGRQFVTGYDKEAGGVRTFYLDRIVNFPTVE